MPVLCTPKAAQPKRKAKYTWSPHKQYDGEWQMGAVRKIFPGIFFQLFSFRFSKIFMLFCVSNVGQKTFLGDPPRQVPYICILFQI
jgi:hypothetical protein